MADITSNLVAWYKLDETSGTSAVDSSGNGNTLTMGRDFSLTSTTGQINKAILCDGTNDTGTNTTSTITNAASTITIAAWLKTSTNNKTALLISQNASGTAERVRLSIGESGSGKFSLFGRIDGEASQEIVSSTATYADNAWHHVVGVVNLATDSMVLYVDGALATTTGTPAFTGTAWPASNPNTIRLSGVGGASRWNGTIDDVRIYNRALTAEDVAFLFRFGADITSQLVAHYKLDEISGTSAADSSGNGNTGTYVNGPLLNQAGAFGGSKAVTLNGINQHILLTDITQLNSVSAFTFSAWIYCNGNGLFSQIFGKIGASVNSRIFLSFYPDNTSLFLGVSNGGDTKGNTASVIPQNTWAHVTMVFDGTLTGDANRLKVYVNAVQKTITQFGVAVPATTANLAGYIADIGFDGGSPFKGTLDDVRIYSRALSASDVSALYAYSGNPDITSGLVAHYKLDESGGTTAVDSSGNGYTGTHSGSPTVNQTGAFANSKGVLYGGAKLTTLPDLPLNSVSTFTFSCWAKGNSPGTYNNFFTKFSDNNNRIQFCTGGVNTTLGLYISSGVVDSSASATSALSTTGWDHVVVVYDGSQATNATKLKAYVNGVAVTLSFSNNIPATTSNLAGIAAKISGNNGGDYYYGTLDDVRIYSRALTPDEVAYLYSVNFSTTTSILQAPAKTITEVSPLMVANATYPYIFRSRTL